jgi:uncharacterized protein with NAD-binding domain and iron-sulfur cluster
VSGAKTRVAVLGGGAGALAAAFELSKTAALRERFEVTVHQLGWRLGGKGASGRNQEYADRIEEHGLHIWFGFYDNGFDLMKRCYAALDRQPPAPLATWDEAFKPCDNVVLYENWKGRWIGRQFTFRQNDATPGEGPAPAFWDVIDMVIDAIHWLRRECWPPKELDPLEDVDPLALARAVVQRRQRVPESIEDELGELAELAELADQRVVCELMHDFMAIAWVLLKDDMDDDCLRFLYMTADLAAATICGILADDLLNKGFGVINDKDLREWLGDHGCSDLTLAGSPVLRGMYDLAFGYEDGDVEKPNMAAGATLSAMVRIAFGYKGAILWKMQAGMGDTVFTPLYQVLSSRGVKFEFFNWITGLAPSADGTRVESIELIQQAQVAGGGEYRPLIPVDDLDCWPSEPDYRQLVDGDRLRGIDLEQVVNPLGVEPTTLTIGSDFDLVVLGIPVGALPPICGSLVTARGGAKLKAAIDSSATVMTQAFQVWMNESVDGLGWAFDPDSAASSYVEPLDTYCNMTHLLRREAWNPALGVQSISYFCGVMQDVAGESQQQADARAKQNALAYMTRSCGQIFPNAVTNGGFDWDLLVDMESASGPARFDSQYWRANFQLGERYVMTPKGSVDKRIDPGDTGFSNMFAAGDWTRNDIDGGSVEGAVTSGIMAGRAAAGDPTPPLGVEEWFSGRTAARDRGALAEGIGVTAELPEYVEYGALATVPSQLLCEGAHLTGFWLEGDGDKLAALLDKVFDVPSGGAVRVEPIGHYLMATFGVIDRITCTVPPFDRMGAVTEPQVALWMPTIVTGPGGQSEMAWFVPYIWLDNPISLCSGREVFGWSKTFGWPVLPDDGGPNVWALDAYGMNYTGSEPPARRRLITVTERERDGDAAADGGESALGRLRELADDVAGKLLDTADAGLQAALAAAGCELPLGNLTEVYLKQFRDIADGKRAALQQVVQAKMGVELRSATPLLGRFDVTIEHLDSDPLFDELGLKDGRALLAYEVEMDFTVGDGTVIWPG